jgi:methionyl-tRNA formyltransferase
MVGGRSLRIVFFGTPAFAVPTLDTLLDSTHTIAAVVTQPDRPRGRGQKADAGLVKTRALEAGIPVWQPDKLSEPAFLAELAALGADLGVVAAYGKILSERVLSLPKLGMVNVHASILPKYRGAAPVHRAILAGEIETGVTIMRVVKALDAGPMLAVARRSIDPDETSAEVEQDLARIGASLLRKTIDDMAAGVGSERPQNDAEATYAHRLTKDDGRLDWSLSAQAVHNRIRGLHPWPHAFSTLQGNRLILLRSSVGGEPTSRPPGTILTARGDELSVATGGGTIRILQIQPEGKRPLTAREFLAGHRLEPGERFTTPA